MAELQDYSGEFRPDLNMRDFSKDALIGLWQAAGKMYIGVDGLWHDMVRECYGEEAALELSTQIWLRRGGSEMEVSRVRQAMRILGDDVASYLKFLQVDPGFAGVMDIQCELKDENHGIVTVKRCRPLESLEKLGDTQLQKHVCEVLDQEGFQVGCRMFNPKMKAIPLKLPPRESKNDIACQWEFRMDA